MVITVVAVIQVNHAQWHSSNRLQSTHPEVESIFDLIYGFNKTPITNYFPLHHNYYYWIAYGVD